jgi:hypothetical protein
MKGAFAILNKEGMEKVDIADLLSRALRLLPGQENRPNE